MKKKIPFVVYLFFILVYANQGISSLPGQCIYYLTRENWQLSATMLGLIGFITGLAWYIKPIFGIIVDYFSSIEKTKNYLIWNTSFIILACLFVILFGLNLMTLLIVFTLINFAIAGNDVTNDKEMCILEKKYNLKGRIQAIQWTSLGVAGLLVSIVGALIADKIPEPYNYKIAYLGMSILPIILLIYLIKCYKEPKNKKQNLKINWSYFKNKEFLIGLLFILFLRFSPSFGKALMIKMREQMLIGKIFIGYLGATGTVLGLLGYILYYWKGYKVNMKKLLYFTIIFSGFANLCYLWIPNKWIIFSYSIIFGAFDGIAFLTILAFIAKIVPNGNEAFFYALITSVNNFSGRLGGLLGGFIYDQWGYTINVIVASVTTFLCILFIPYLKVKEIKNEL